MAKPNRQLIKTTMRVPQRLWEAFKLVAEEQGTCTADLLRSLIHETVRKAPPRRTPDPIVQMGLWTAEESAEFRELCRENNDNPRRLMLGVLGNMRKRANSDS
jgi:hypothetical protein